LKLAEEADVLIETHGLTIEGKSRAGNETWFRIRELGIALDIGRCPDAIVPITSVFVTHPHLDHSLGIPYYFAQRKLLQLPTGTIYLPAEIVEQYRELIEKHEELQRTRYDFKLVGLAHGESVKVRKDIRVRAAMASHSVPSAAWEVIETRRRIKPEYDGWSEDRIKDVRATGVEVSRALSSSLLFYTGDTDSRIFELSPELFRSKILMIECTFVASEDRHRARQYRHIHLDDILDVARRFENETIILTHFSSKDRAAETRAAIESRLPASIRDRVSLALGPERGRRVAS